MNRFGSGFLFALFFNQKKKKKFKKCLTSVASIGYSCSVPVLLLCKHFFGLGM